MHSLLGGGSPGGWPVRVQEAGERTDDPAPGRSLRGPAQRGGQGSPRACGKLGWLSPYFLCCCFWGGVSLSRGRRQFEGCWLSRCF